MSYSSACSSLLRSTRLIKLALLLVCSSFSVSAYAALDTEISFLEQENSFYRFEIVFSERVRYFSHRNIVTNGELLSFKKVDDKTFHVELFLSNRQEDGVLMHLPRRQVYSVFGEWNSNASLYVAIDEDGVAQPNATSTATTSSQIAATARSGIRAEQAEENDVVSALVTALTGLQADNDAAVSPPRANTTTQETLDPTATTTDISSVESDGVSELGDNEIAPDVRQAADPAVGSVSAELYLLSTKNSRGKKVIQIKFTSPVQGIEKRHFYANTRVTDFYGEYDDYFVELQPFPEGEERTTRIALIADYYFNAEVNRVIFVPIEIYAEFPADATAGSQASVSYGTLNSNFVESLRQASAYIPPSAAAPVTVVTTEEVANVLNPTLSPIVSDSKLPGDVRDMSVKPPAEWQWGLVFNAGINSGGTELVYSDPSTEPQIDVSTVTDFPTFGGGIRWGTDQQFWQFQALLDYSTESFETSDSSSTFTRTDIHLQWIYPVSGWSSMPFVRTFGVAAGLTYSIPSIEHSGNITSSTLYSRATDLGSSTGFNYSLRWTAPNGSSIFEYRSIVGLDYNAAFMSGDTADHTVADTVSGDYTGFFYSYVFQ